ncbi:MAG: LEA type 2 family protein [Bacteroidota bacterium]|nr:LEA type 2 family protein [Bacteroidota bacterium]
MKPVCCILFLSVLLLSSCGIIKPISVISVENFKTENVFTKPEFRFDVGIRNPNNFSVTIQKMELGVSVAGPEFATISLMEGIRVTKRDTMIIPVSLFPSITEISSLFSSGINAFLSGKENQLFELRGELVIRKFIFRKRYKIKESIRL